jgi:hypothetical protein
VRGLLALREGSGEREVMGTQGRGGGCQAGVGIPFDVDLQASWMTSGSRYIHGASVLVRTDSVIGRDVVGPNRGWKVRNAEKDICSEEGDCCEG